VSNAFDKSRCKEIIDAEVARGGAMPASAFLLLYTTMGPHLPPALGRKWSTLWINALVMAAPPKEREATMNTLLGVLDALLGDLTDLRSNAP